jgi:CTP synthase (UTP-ammonia lyase)
VHLVVIEAEKLEHEAHDPESVSMQELKSLDGIVVPGGFDKRGIEGKIMCRAMGS